MKTFKAVQNHFIRVTLTSVSSYSNYLLNLVFNYVRETVEQTKYFTSH